MSWLALTLLLASPEPGSHVPRRREAVPPGDERLQPTLRRHARRFLRCGEEVPPGGEGRVVLRFSIDRAGRAHAFSTSEDSLGAPAVGRCLEQVLRSLTFGPAPREADEVQVPFRFVGPAR